MRVWEEYDIIDADSGKKAEADMAITSFYFLCFFAALLLLYYSIPRRFQWGFLLLCSVIYLLLAGQGALIL